MFTFLDDAGVGEHAVKVIQRRFSNLANPRREFAECSDDEHRAHLLAPLLASACRAAAMTEAEMEPFRTADIVWRAVKQEGDRATGVIDLSDQLQVLSIFLIHYHQTMLLTSVTLRLPRSHSSCARHQA